MVEEPAHLILDHLRAIRTEMGGLRDDVRELKTRMTTVDHQIASLTATIAGNYAGTATRLDRMEVRIEHIERRLGLADA